MPRASPERRAAFKLRYSEGDEPIPGYRLMKRLGQGGVGQVFKAVGPGGVSVALKIISGLDQAGGRKELRALQNVKNIGHANLVSIYGFWLKDEDGAIIEFNAEDDLQPEGNDTGGLRPAQLFIVMRLCEGSLFDRLQECKKKGLGGIPDEELIGYCEDAARAIDYLNTRCNMQHCDIKPQNILIVGGTAQVCDYGLVKEVDDPRRSTNMVSPLYAAPELLPMSDRDPGPSHATDQCSLAMSYVELRSGRLPFKSSVNPDNPFQVMQAVAGGDLDFSRLNDGEAKVLKRATARDPGQRFESCVKMVRELRRAVEGTTAETNVVLETRPVAPVAPYRLKYQEGDEAIPGLRLIKRVGGEGLDELFLASGRDASNVSLKIIYDLDEETARKELQFLQKMRDIRHPYLVPVNGVWLKYEDGGLMDHNPAADDRSLATVPTDGVNRGPLRRAQVFLAMQLCEGNLEDRLREFQQLGGEGLPADELAGYLEEAARAIDYLNTVHGVPHRDIKPQNIQVVGGVALVGNYGLARNPCDPRRSLTDSLPFYAAPELLPQPGDSGDLPATATSDLYSLAVTYAHLRQGRMPFKGESPGAVLANIIAGSLDLEGLSPAERRVLEMATAHNPMQRHSSAVQMVRDLRAALAEAAKEEASAKSAAKPNLQSPEDEASVRLRSPFKLRYDEGDEPIPGIRLVERLGAAGVDEVFHAIGHDDEKLALKIRYNLDEPDARSELRFLQRMASVRHPHLVAIDDIWLKNEDSQIIGPSQLGDDPLPEPVEAGSRPPRGAQLFIAMPLCDGNLADRLAEMRRVGRPGIPPDELLGYFEEAAKAVDFLNTVLNTQHCNLKPQNILLLGGVAQLADLSATHTPLDVRCTAELLVPFYAPPELLPVSDSEPGPSTTSDQYSLAMCYVELRTGCLPFHVHDVIESMVAISSGEVDLSALPEEEQKIIAKALSLDSTQRYSSAANLVKALRRAVEGAVTGLSAAGGTKRATLHVPYQPRYAEGDEPLPGYRLLERLGSSGYDEVFRAAGPGAKKFALKIIYGFDEFSARREFRKLQRVKEIRHSHLIDIDDIWLKDESGYLYDQSTLPDDVASTKTIEANKPRAAQLFFSMPLSEASLADLLQEFKKTTEEQGIPAVDLVGYLDAAAKAIDHLNNVHGMAHGEIRPRHLLIHGGAIRLSDFGLTKERPMGKLLGPPLPPYYTAPELLKEVEPPPVGNVRSDLYALAICYVELRTGKLPFASNDPAEVRQDVLAHRLDLTRLTPTEAGVIGKALSRRPEKRFSSAGEMVRQIRQALPMGMQGMTVAEGQGSTPTVRYPIKSKYGKGDEPVPGHRLIELIGRGGFGDVWKATAPGGIREVALKIVYDAGSQLGQRELVGLWQIKKITHENMVPIYGLWIKDREGNLVDDDLIAAMEREVNSEQAAAPPNQARNPGGSVAPTVDFKNGSPPKRPAGNTAHAGVTRPNRVPPAGITPKNTHRGTIQFEKLPDESLRGTPTKATVAADPGPMATLADFDPVADLQAAPRKTFEPAQLFIAMQLCDGHLLHALNRCKEQGLTGIPPEDLLRHFDAASEVIDDFNLNHNTRHRDIKPQNLLTIGKALKVCDFGLVRKSSLSNAGQGLAFTPEYAAPEQVVGDDSPSTDQYCLAVSYAHLRTGSLPYRSNDAHEIMAAKRQDEAGYFEFLELTKLTRRERDVLRRALSLDPDSRFASCKELSTALREAVFGNVQPPPPPRSSWWVPALAALLLVAALGVAGVAFLLLGDFPLEGTIDEVDLEKQSLIVVDQADRRHTIFIGEKTEVILDGRVRPLDYLRKQQHVEIRRRLNGRATRISATLPEIPSDLMDQLGKLIDEGKLGEALDIAQNGAQLNAEDYVITKWSARCEAILKERRLDSVLALADEAALAVKRIPATPELGQQQSQVVAVLLGLADRERARKQADSARRVYAFLVAYSLDHEESPPSLVWHRDALLGLVRVGALQKPAAWSELAATLDTFDGFSSQHGNLEELTTDQQAALRPLRVIDAEARKPADLASSFKALLSDPAWRKVTPDWQVDSIDRLQIKLVDDLDRGTLSPDLKELARTLLNFENLIARAEAKLRFDPPDFKAAAAAIKLALFKSSGDDAQAMQANVLLAEALLLDPTADDREAADLFASVAEAALKADKTTLFAALRNREKIKPNWISTELLENLLTAFRRLPKAGIEGAEIGETYADLAARHIVAAYADQGLAYPELLPDYQRIKKSGITLEPDLQALLDACWVEFVLEDRRAQSAGDLKSPTIAELQASAQRAEKTLAGKSYGPYSTYVRAMADWRADPKRSKMAAEVLHDLPWKSPPASLAVHLRRNTAAEILLSGEALALARLNDAEFSPAGEYIDAVAQARRHEALARDLLGDPDFARKSPAITVLADAWTTKPDWAEVRKRSQSLLADGKSRSAAEQESWLGHLYLASVRANLASGVAKLSPQERGLVVQHAAEALRKIGGPSPDRTRAKLLSEELLKPTLDAAQAGVSTEANKALASLLVAKGKFLQENSRLSEVYSPEGVSAAILAFDSFDRAAGLDPENVETLVARARAFHELQPREQLRRTPVTFDTLVAAANNAPGASSQHGVLALEATQLLLKARKQSSQQYQTLSAAIDKYLAALAATPPAHAYRATYLLELSYAHLEGAFYGGTTPEQKTIDLEKAAKYAEEASQAEPHLKKMEYAFVAWGNALEDLALYVFIKPEQLDQRKKYYSLALQKFTQANDPPTSLAGLALGRCRYRMATKCQLRDREAEDELKLAQQDLESAFNDTSANDLNRAEIKYTIGQCLAHRAVLDRRGMSPGPEGRATLRDSADASFSEAIDDFYRLEISEWPIYQLDAASFALNVRGKSALAVARATKVIVDDRFTIRPEQRCEAVEIIAAAATSGADRIGAIDAHISRFNGDDEQQRTCRARLLLARGEIRQSVSDSEWAASKAQCKTDSAAAQGLLEQLPPGAKASKAVRDLRLRSFLLSGGWRFREIVAAGRSPELKAQRLELYKSAAEQFQKAIDLADKDVPASLAARRKIAQLIQQHISYTADPSELPALKSRALKALEPIEPKHLDSDSYGKLEKLRDWFNK